MDSKQSLTADDVVNTYDAEELATLIAENGEERFARRSRAASSRRDPLHTTRELVDVIRASFRRRRGVGAGIRRVERSRRSAWRSTASSRILPTGSATPYTSSDLKAGCWCSRTIRFEDRMVKETFAPGRDTGAAPSLPNFAIPEAPRHPLVRLLTRRPLRRVQTRWRQSASRERPSARGRATADSA